MLVPPFICLDDKDGRPVWGGPDSTTLMKLSRNGKPVRTRGTTGEAAAFIEAAGKEPWPRELPHQDATAHLPISLRGRREFGRERPSCRWVTGGIGDLAAKREWICAPPERDAPNVRTYLLQYFDRKRGQDAAVLVVLRQRE